MVTFLPRDIPYSVAFSGYRPQKLPFGNDLTHPAAIKLRQELKETYRKLILKGYRRFLTGGALGSDLMAAEVIQELKERYFRFRIKSIICIPCVNYTAKWNDFDKHRLRALADKCDKVLCVTHEEYRRGCMLERNRFMVDNSSVLLAVCNQMYKGGTQYTVDYAMQQNKKVLILDPVTSLLVEPIATPRQAEQLFLADNNGPALENTNDDYDYYGNRIYKVSRGSKKNSPNGDND